MSYRVEIRIDKRATLKGKDSKRDTESHSFLHDLVDDALAVLGLPHWAVAEDFLQTLMQRLFKITGRSSQHIFASDRTMMVDILSASFLGLVKYRERVRHLALNANLRPAEIEGASDDLTKLLEVQQENFCTSFAEFFSGQSIAAPIKLARSKQGKCVLESVFEERSRQVLLNYLSVQENFGLRQGGVCSDAFLYHLLRWRMPDDEDHNSDAKHFWSAQFNFMVNQHSIPAPRTCLVSEEQIERVSLNLVLCGSLFSKLPARLNRFLHHLMNEDNAADKAKMLRAVKDISGIQADLLHPGFLRRVGDDMLLAGGNANLRASAVDLLASVCLNKMRQSQEVSDAQVCPRMRSLTLV